MTYFIIILAVLGIVGIFLAARPTTIFDVGKRAVRGRYAVFNSFTGGICGFGRTFKKPESAVRYARRLARGNFVVGAFQVRRIE